MTVTVVTVESPLNVAVMSALPGWRPAERGTLNDIRPAGIVTDGGTHKTLVSDDLSATTTPPAWAGGAWSLTESTGCTPLTTTEAGATVKLFTSYGLGFEV